jgi:hypothetical protein
MLVVDVLAGERGPDTPEPQSGSDIERCASDDREHSRPS